jgi:hypothetical protein
MSLYETVLVMWDGAAGLRRVSPDEETILISSCPFEIPTDDDDGDKTVAGCGTWCALFEISQSKTHNSENGIIDTLTTIRLHCGNGTRQFNNLRIIEDL